MQEAVLKTEGTQFQALRACLSFLRLICVCSNFITSATSQVALQKSYSEA